MRALERRPMGQRLGAELYDRTAQALAHELARVTGRSVQHALGLAESVFAAQPAIEAAAVAILEARDLAVAALLEHMANCHEGVWVPTDVPDDLPHLRAWAQEQ